MEMVYIYLSLVNIRHILSYKKKILVLVMRTFKFYSLSNFQICKTTLLTSHHAVYLMTHLLYVEVCTSDNPNVLDLDGSGGHMTTCVCRSSQH